MQLRSLLAALVNVLIPCVVPTDHNTQIVTNGQDVRFVARGTLGCVYVFGSLCLLLLFSNWRLVADVVTEMLNSSTMSPLIKLFSTYIVQ